MTKIADNPDPYLIRALIPRSLYIHVPFCVRRCSYCDFAVEAMREPPVGEWLDCVTRELAVTLEEQGCECPIRLDTLYLGGGTPSLLGPSAMEALRERLSPFVALETGAEWTCEANPESFTPAVAAAWKSAGVNRISLGVQTFDPEALSWMGRLHGPEGAKRAVSVARDAGFTDVSIDLIFALPSRLRRDWAADLEQAVALDPDHVSLYGLTAETGTPLGKWIGEGREHLPGEDDYAEQYLLAHEVLSGAGFEHYEVSNFARAGKRSRHNFTYWTGAPYLALGPGAHSYLPPLRRWNLRSWFAYRDALLTGGSPVEGEERIDEETIDLERVWLGLRTSRGFRIAGGLERAEIVRRWAAAGLAVLEGGVVRLTPAGWLLLDRLALDLHEAGSGVKRKQRESVDGRRQVVQIAANSNPSTR